MLKPTPPQTLSALRRPLNAAAATLLTLSCGLAAPVHAESGVQGSLLLNGSFEQFEVVLDRRRYQFARLANWTALDSSAFGAGAEVGTLPADALGEAILSEVWGRRIGRRATEGSYKIELDNGNAVDALLQSVATEDGHDYQLSFDAYARSRRSSDIEVWVDGIYRNTVTPNRNWTHFEFTIHGNGQAQTIMLREVPGQNNSYGAIIDKVAVTEVPLQPLDTLISSGSALAGSEWTRVTAANSDQQPLIILGSPSANDDAPGVGQLRNAGPDGFELRFREWQYLDAEHPLEQIDWLSIAPGHYILEDGTLLEAGRFDTNPANQWTRVGFEHPFPGTPALFLTTQTNNDPLPAAVRVRSVRNNGFRARLQHEEKLRGNEVNETIGYLAIYTHGGEALLNGDSLEVLRRARLDHRHKTLLGDSFWVQEEQSRNKEVRHTREYVDLLSFGGRLFAQDTSTRGFDTSTIRREGNGATIIVGGLRVGAIDSNSAELSWNAASGADADQVSAYRVLQDGNAINNVASTNYLAVGLNPSSEYRFQVQAIDTNGRVLADSNSLTLSTEAVAQPPASPTAAKATDIGRDALTLSWAAPASSPSSGEVEGYNIYRDGQRIAVVSGTSHRDSGLQAGTAYSYRITAFGPGGESAAASLSVTTLPAADTQAPSAPGQLLGQLIDNGQGTNSVALSWQPATDNTAVTGYIVLRDGNEIATTSTTSYTDSGLSEATSYQYSVIAIDAAGNRSIPATAINVSTPDASAPSVPAELSAQAQASNNPGGGDGVIRITWQAASDNVAVLGYELLRNGELIASVANPGHTDTDVLAGTDYQYQVRAFDAAGNRSALSASATARIVPPLVSGQTLAQTCYGCHGDSATSVGPATPTLAGMYKDYLIRAMQDFRDDSRHSTIMGRVAKAYSDDELSRMGEHFASLAYTPANQVVNLSQAAAGQSVHNNSCNSCHGNGGLDNDNGLLGGQWMPYLSATIADFNSGLSTGVPGSMIAQIQSLSDQQRADLVQYYGSHGSDTQAPPAPTSLSASSTEFSVTLSWLDVDDNWDIARYEISRDGNTIADSEFAVYTDSGLQPGTSYQYSVIAIDTIGNRSLASNTLSVRTAGQPVVTDPDAQRGQNLWDGNGCGQCHSSAEALAQQLADKGLSFEQGFQNAIDENLGGMGNLFGGLSGQDIADLGAYLEAEVEGSEPPPTGIQGITLLNNADTLRKAAILLAGRLPTDAELSAASDAQGLQQTLRGLMSGERFSNFLLDTGRRFFLTEGVEDQEAFREDFPYLQALRDDGNYGEYNRSIDDLREEPLQLLRYIVENDRSWQEIITADYGMVNTRLAAAYQAQTATPPSDENDWVPGNGQLISARSPELAARPFPHAGVLTTRAWLSRFPTTDSNRNRHRAKVALQQFVGVDIESLGQRPLDDSENGDFLVPTMENPACLLCHSSMEPVATAFSNWGTDNQYWQSDAEDSLSEDYKSGDYYLNHDGEPWHQDGDKVYRDMLEPGYEGKKMPGSYLGFASSEPAQVALPVNNFEVIAASTPGAENLFDGDTASRWQARNIAQPQFTVDIVWPANISGIRYTPRRYGNNWHAIDYRIETSLDNINWTLADEGRFSNTDTRDTKSVSFAGVEGRYLRFTALSSTNPDNLEFAEFEVLREGDSTVPYASNANGGGDSLQWLAREMANDPRFAKAAALFWYQGLFGQPPVAAPVDPGAPGYATQLAAYQTQNAILDPIAEQFAASGYLVKDLLAAMISSDLFRANGSDGDLSASQQLALDQLPTGRLLSPAELDAKGLATVGREFFGDQFNNLGLVYGGFDGGEDTTTGNTDITSMMLSAAETRIYRQLCDNRILRNDLDLPVEQRRLLTIAQESDQPYPLTVPNVTPSATQPIEHYVWNDISGSRVYNLEDNANYPNRPSQVDYISALDTPIRVADNYGQRLRVLLVPPTDGNYQFWVSGNERASLRLSSDSDSRNLTEIASLPGYSSQYQWDKYPEQQSALIPLVGGQRYFLEVVHKEGSGNDHLSVSWSGPGIAQSIITADYLQAPPPSISADTETDRIRANLQHLHALLLGETLAADDPEIDRSFALFKEVFENDAAEDSGLDDYCELRNGNTPSRRAWNAVLAYLMTDFRYLNH